MKTKDLVKNAIKHPELYSWADLLFFKKWMKKKKKAKSEKKKQKAA